MVSTHLNKYIMESLYMIEVTLLYLRCLLLETLFLIELFIQITIDLDAIDTR